VVGSQSQSRLLTLVSEWDTRGADDQAYSELSYWLYFIWGKLPIEFSWITAFEMQLLQRN